VGIPVIVDDRAVSATRSSQNQTDRGNRHYLMTSSIPTRAFAEIHASLSTGSPIPRPSPSSLPRRETIVIVTMVPASSTTPAH
jgi:hypothetical protein